MWCSSSSNFRRDLNTQPARLNHGPVHVASGSGDDGGQQQTAPVGVGQQRVTRSEISVAVCLALMVWPSPFPPLCATCPGLAEEHDARAGKRWQEDLRPCAVCLGSPADCLRGLCHWEAICRRTTGDSHAAAHVVEHERHVLCRPRVSHTSRDPLPRYIRFKPGYGLTQLLLS